MSDLISYGFLAPPTVLIVLGAIGAWAALRFWRPGIGLAIVATSLLYLLALPVIASCLLRGVEIAPPAASNFAAAQAIVVLGGGIHLGDGKDIPDTLGSLSLERVVFGARAYRQLHLKVAVSGGQIRGAHVSEASLMKAMLESDFAVPVTWVEDRSRTTWENAANTAKLLKPAGIDTVVVVTHAWHMKRAQWSLEHNGLRALPWPAAPTVEESGRIDDYLPSTGALQSSFYALHEAIGLAYYRMRY
jgi:uncharacterized SAM-binding protein YcdF (DUF218 family)